MSDRDRTRLRSLVRKATDPIYHLKRRARLRAAGIWRRQFAETLFVGITGSHGKTTATALLAEMLATVGPTYAGTQYNQSKMIARDVLRARPRRLRYFVQEVSGHRPGVVDDSVGVLCPAVGIVTAIGGDHRKAFAGSLEATAAEKAKLVERLPAEGLAVLNADDPLVAAMAGDCRCRVVTFGRGEGADLRILDATSAWPDRLTFDAAYRGKRFVVRTRLIGAHWTLSTAAALLAALELGTSRAACLEVIESHEPLFNRMSVHAAPNGAWYVLDAAKASFSGIGACIDFLDAASAPRKTVIFGMLADYSGASRPKYHKVARMALGKADRVIFTGKEAQRVRRLVEQYEGRLLIVDRPEDVRAMLANDTVADELIYIKASQASKLGSVFVPPSQR
jgi:UDP-N-acetylmuramoyl-tripeptide--D-alanyl-D-alanine ligase